MNYAALRTAVQDYCENTFSDSDFATMTKLAEQTINNTAQLPTLRTNATLTLVVNTPKLAVPIDFLSALSIAVIDSLGVFSYLLNKDVNFIRESYPDPAVTGTPKYYAIFGTVAGLPKQLSFIFGPTPSAALSAQLEYFAYPESIVTATNTWLGDNFDTVLFNGIMVETGRFMKQEQDIIALYDKRFTESLALLKNLGDGKERQDMYRSGQVRDRVV